ncbi:TolC family protein [Paraburkholderia gardini]|nr:TolC family protein [Paraburkholderia gardini]
MQLDEVVERALCRNPLTARTWANAQVQAARLGQAQAARLPTISGVVSGSANQANTSSTSSLASQGAYDGPARAAELSLDWVLLDFGARRAEVRKARELLAAADESFNAAVLDVLYATARDYFAALTARAQVDAARMAQANALQSLNAVRARLASGVVSIADELQARTAHNEATLRVVKATNALHEAEGTLAIDMGLQPDVPIHLVDIPENVRDTRPPLEGIRLLIEQALATHPRLRAARAERNATDAAVDVSRAQGLPSVHLEAGLSRSTRPGASMGDDLPVTSTSRSNYVGVRVTIPFFDGFGTTYRIKEARMQAEVQRANLAETEQQVALNVWKSYEAVRSGADTLEQAEALQQNAALAFDATRARYNAGIANIVELLRAQDVLVDATQQRISVQSDWRVARLSLAASLGKLDISTFRNRP